MTNVVLKAVRDGRYAQCSILDARTLQVLWETPWMGGLDPFDRALDLANKECLNRSWHIVSHNGKAPKEGR